MDLVNQLYEREMANIETRKRIDFVVAMFLGVISKDRSPEEFPFDVSTDLRYKWEIFIDLGVGLGIRGFLRAPYHLLYQLDREGIQVSSEHLAELKDGINYFVEGVILHFPEVREYCRQQEASHAPIPVAAQSQAVVIDMDTRKRRSRSWFSSMRRRMRRGIHRLMAGARG